MSTRKQARSDSHRIFAGYVVMVLDEYRRWYNMFPDPLSWILEFEDHKHFMSVFRKLYSDKFGSYYVEHATEERIKETIMSVDIATFRNLLFIASTPETIPKPADSKKQNVGAPPVCVAVEQQEQIEEGVVEDIVVEDSASVCCAEVLEEPLASNVLLLPEPAVFMMETNLLYATEKVTEVKWNEEENQKLVDNIVRNEIFENYNCDRTEIEQLVFSRKDTFMGKARIFKLSEKLKEVYLNNDVYNYGEAVYHHLDYTDVKKVGAKFPIVIYAPPGSGKTTLNRKLFNSRARDTDQMLYWSTWKYSPVVFTNMSHYVRRAHTSIMIIPSRAVFEERCRGRGLNPSPSWYDDVWRDSEHATVVLEHDWYLEEVFERHRDIKRLCVQIETRGLGRDTWRDLVI